MLAEAAEIYERLGPADPVAAAGLRDVRVEQGELAAAVAPAAPAGRGRSAVPGGRPRPGPPAGGAGARACSPAIARRARALAARGAGGASRGARTRGWRWPRRRRTGGRRARRRSRRSGGRSRRDPARGLQAWPALAAAAVPDREGAVRFLEERLALRPDDAALHVLHARALDRAGRRPDAFQALRRALDRDRSGEVTFSLRELLRSEQTAGPDELAARHDLLVAALLRRGRAPRCGRCGADAPARIWRCRRCGAFDSFPDLAHAPEPGSSSPVVRVPWPAPRARKAAHGRPGRRLARVPAHGHAGAGPGSGSRPGDVMLRARRGPRSLASRPRPRYTNRSHGPRPRHRHLPAGAGRRARPRGAGPPSRPSPSIPRATRRHGDFAVNAAMVLAKARRQAAPRAGAGHRRGGPRRGRRRGARLAGDRRPRLHQRAARARRLVPGAGAAGGGGQGLRPHRGGEGQEGHRRVRLCQPHRPHARRPRARGGGRRRRPEPAPLGRLRRHPRVLRQRLRRPGADAGPLGPPPLPGAPRPDRHHAAQELPGRLREGRRRRAQGRVRRPVPRRSRGRVAGLFRDRGVAHVLELIRADLAAINIQFDVWSSEKALYESGTVDRFLRMLEEKDLVYVGKLPPPRSKKGQPPPQPQSDEEGVTALRGPDPVPLVALRRRGGPAGEEGRRDAHLLLRGHRLPLGRSGSGPTCWWTCSAPTTAATCPRLRGARWRRWGCRPTTCTCSSSRW